MAIDKPRFLYKYCSADRALQVLEDLYVYLCPPKDLNDLYEGSLGRMLQYSPEIGFELKWRQIRAHTGWGDEEAKQFVREEDHDPDDLRANFDYTADRLRELNALVRHHAGIACFSERRGDQRMWGTYGDNHQGVCIEFANHGEASLIHRHCLPVLYGNERLDNSLPELMREDGSLHAELFAYYCYLRKTRDWESEREWRILMLANDAQPPESRRLSFQRADVKRVFLGPRISSEHSDRIHELASRMSPDWGVFRLRPDSDRGITDFEGIEVVKSFEDLEYWWPAIRSPKTPT